MHEGGPYTFGDGELAAERLELLANAYEPATRALLEWASLGRVPTVVDLGCGPGHTTRLLCELLGPGETIGLDSSPLYLGRARQDAPRGVRFLEHDVARGPLPVPPGCVLFCRFLLAHLGEPGRVLADWARSVGPGGVLLMQETAELRSELPALGRYYAWVGTMQAHYGQSLYIGRQLTALAEASGWRVRAARETVNQIPVPVMARLHAMNLETWRQEPFVVAHHSREELDLLADELDALSSAPASGSVGSVLGEAVLEAAGG
jgi:SAM-dependent methyltransferase